MSAALGMLLIVIAALAQVSILPAFSIFGAQPNLTIDNREVIEAGFLDPAEISDPDDKLFLYLRRATRNVDMRATRA